MARRVRASGVSQLSGFGLNAFTEDQLDTIHCATLEVLESIGVKVESQQALEIFQGAGAQVDRREGHGIVKIPPYLVERCIRMAPRSTVFCGRGPEDDFVAEPHRVTFSTFGECMSVIDPVTRAHRSSTKRDCGDIARLCDRYDAIGVVERAVCSGDAPPETLPLHNAEAIFSNTSKHVFVPAVHPRNVRPMVELASACIGGEGRFRERPLFTTPVCPTSPLTLVENCCDVIIEAAPLGVGLWIISMALTGATSPITLAGTLVTHNAEVLSALCLAQSVAPGTRCVYSGVSTMMDLRTTVAAVGAPELALLSAGVARLAQYYGLPSWVGGGLSDSKIPDAQAAYEATLSATVAALAGANIVYGAGVLDQGMTFDYAKFVMDLEMLGMLRQVLDGIEINDETLALDVIREVGPGGEYLSANHTFVHMRQRSQSKLFDRTVRDAWQAAGGSDLTERAYEEARKVLASHEPKPLPARAAEAMREIILEFERELGI